MRQDMLDTMRARFKELGCTWRELAEAAGVGVDIPRRAMLGIQDPKLEALCRILESMSLGIHIAGVHLDHHDRIKEFIRAYRERMPGCYSSRTAICMSRFLRLDALASVTFSLLDAAGVEYTIAKI